jgi:hypothetical protein
LPRIKRREFRSSKESESTVDSQQSTVSLYPSPSGRGSG